MLKELNFISRAIGKELWKGLSRFEFLKGLSGCEVMNGCKEWVEGVREAFLEEATKNLSPEGSIGISAGSGERFSG